VQAYISGPLHAVSDIESARKFYLRLADVCKDCGINSYVPHQSSDPIIHKQMPNVNIFEKDFQELVKADLIIADIGKPSSGVGAELGIAFENNKYIIGLYQQNESPSRFVMGMLSRKDTTKLIEYLDHNHCEYLLKQYLLKLNQKASFAQP
jgi:nucleoside 2-deoxyribosyltransferase